MPDRQLHTLMQQLRRITGPKETSALTDAQLLDRFISRQDGAAFEVLVWRHGPMVMSVCRRLLHHEQDAEDAFQATFLVLVRKASSIKKREAVGSWLYRVAYRVALRAKRATPFRCEEQDMDTLPSTAHCVPFERDLWAVLDAEVNLLPYRYRALVVLCYLEGKTNEEAAREIGCPPGTVMSRLAWARERLRRRLIRRGLAISAGALASGLSRNSASAALTPALVAVTTQAGLIAATGLTAASGIISASALALSKGVLRAMFLSKIKCAAGIILAVALAGVGTGFLGYPTLAREQKETKDGSPPTPAARLARQGPVESKSSEVLSEVLQAVNGIDDEETKVKAWLGIAQIQLETGHKAAAQTSAQRAFEIANPIKDEKTKNNCLHIVAWNQALAGDIPGAIRTAPLIKDGLLHVLVLVEIAKAQAKAGDRKTADNSFKECVRLAKALPDVPTPPYPSKEAWRVLALESIVEGKADIGDIPGAFETAEAISGAGGKPWDTYGAWSKIAISESRAGRFQKTFEIMQKIEVDYDQQLKTGTLQKALQPGESYDLESQKSEILREIAFAQAKSGMLQKASETTKLIHNAHDPAERERCRALWFLTKEQAKAGDFASARKTAEAASDNWHKAMALQLIARAQWEHKDPAAAKKTCQQALDLASAPNDYGPEPLFLIAELQAMMGDLDGALKTADSIKSYQGASINFELYDTPFQIMSFKNSALMFIARVQSRKGDIKGALKTIESFEVVNDNFKWYSDQLKAYCYREIAKAKVKAGDMKGALQWAKERSSSLEKSEALQGVVEGVLEPKATR